MSARVPPKMHLVAFVARWCGTEIPLSHEVLTAWMTMSTARAVCTTGQETCSPSTLHHRKQPPSTVTTTGRRVPAMKACSSAPHSCDRCISPEIWRFASPSHNASSAPEAAGDRAPTSSPPGTATSFLTMDRRWHPARTESMNPTSVHRYGGNRWRNVATVCLAGCHGPENPSRKPGHAQIWPRTGTTAKYVRLFAESTRARNQRVRIAHRSLRARRAEPEQGVGRESRPGAGGSRPTAGAVAGSAAEQLPGVCG